MYIIISIACIIAAVICSIFFGSWIRSRRGSGDRAARLYGIIKSRSTNFWNFHYIPVAAFAVIVSVASGVGISWKNAAACFAGAVIAFACIFIGSRMFVSGSTAAVNEAGKSDIASSIKCSYRTGAVLGLCISSVAVAVFLAAVFFLDIASVMKYAGSMALGASLTSLLLHSGGAVYSSAYSHAAAADDFVDRTGFFAGAGSDFTESFILAGASAMILADVGVATSGVTSTFTNETAAMFVVVVLASGLAGSVIGVFLQRAGLSNDPAKGADIGFIASCIISSALCIYFSLSMMQSAVYAWAAISGIVAGLIISEISRFFSSDSIVFTLSGKSFSRQARTVFNLGTGMVTTAITAAVLIAAVVISFNFASFYGLALCAAGMCSLFGTVAAVTGLSVLSAGTSDIISTEYRRSEDDDYEKISDVLSRVSVRNSIRSLNYRTASGFICAMAMFSALYISSEAQAFDIMNISVFTGLLAGACSAFVITGIIIGSVRVTSRVALREIGRSEDDSGSASSIRGSVIPAVFAIALPTLVGLFFGVNCLAGFIIALIVTGCCIVTAFNNSGRYFENMAIQSLASVIKMMTVFAFAFLPVFIKVGGFLF